MKIMYVFNQVWYNIPYAFIGMYFKCNSDEFSLKFGVQPRQSYEAVEECIQFQLW